MVQILREVEPYITPSTGCKKKRVECKCDCGNIFETLLTLVKNNKTKSCGCLIIKSAKKTHTTHGKSNERIYYIWNSMWNRCNRKEDKSYKYYGGRGIKCLWNNFEEFYKDMHLTYKNGLSIERIDNNGHYCKYNCKWETQKKQNRNTRKNIMYKGKCIAEWCEELGLKQGTIYKRIRYGWSIEKALGL